ncbi:MAG TPA: glutamine--fructose-6-phosphate transaminase (isomerizing) [Thermomicrobiaceae bacterium]|nr:glutamine--fructose-6-phosphate transaminase (isomerizing) [Thermomicrobiaceae bacterium]
MCGIFGYVGPSCPTGPMVLGALRTLEYRGYDSWGVAVGANGHIDVRKQAGRIADATVRLPDATIGFGHTRWATHGGVTDQNAHPHLDCTGRFAVIHNGIIENFRALRTRLGPGHALTSETDTEVVPHLIEDAVGERTDPAAFVEGVRAAFAQLRGLNAIIVMDNLTKQLVAVKNVSPLVVGTGDGASFIASDAIALVGHADRVHYLGDGEVAILGAGGVAFLDAATGAPRSAAFVPLQIGAADTALHGFAHYLDKEIHEQPRVLRNISENYTEPVRQLAAEIQDSFGTFLLGCGTASYAALTGQYLFSRIARRHVNFAVGSEFKYQEHFLTDRSLVIALSQSGETADIIEAVMSAKRVGARVAALVNVAGSTLDRLADVSIHLGAGPEQSVLSTKAFSAKVAILMLAAHVLNGSEHVGREHLWRAVDGVERALSEESIGQIRGIAARVVQREHAFIIGRGLSYPTALEAALKIKEVSYIHAEGFAGGELKHGVIALVEPGTPCIVFSPLDETRDDILSGAMEMKSRGGWIIGISPENDAVFDEHVPVADVGDASPLVGVVPAQLLGYHLALLRGLDPDKPRNLAKSVTVK